LTKSTTRRKITLKGQENLVAFLQPYIQQHQARIARSPTALHDAKELRRALALIFGGNARDSGPVKLDIVSVGQGQARVKRL